MTPLISAIITLLACLPWALALRAAWIVREDLRGAGYLREWGMRV